MESIGFDAFDDMLADLDIAGQSLLSDPPIEPCIMLSNAVKVPLIASPAPSPPLELKPRPYETSIKVFRRHISVTSHVDGSMRIEAEGVLSRACYEDWLSTRSHASKDSEKNFQRILTSSVTGTDGRQPFSPMEEHAIVKMLRQKRVWPAFANSQFSIGSKGFRSCVAHQC